MIVPWSELRRHRRAVTMADGGFDPLHPGHIAYFRAAADLGLPVLCNVAGDDWVRAKHSPLLLQEERATLIDALRWVDLVHCASGPTAEVLRELEPRFYAKGADWEGRLPAEETTVCAERSIAIVFLDTVLASSSEILSRYAREPGGG